MMNSPRLDGLTLQQLRYFSSIAEGETFVDAAGMIGISQSALSQGIARLEQITGVRLLERDGRRRRLTDAGELVAAYARRVIGESETLANDLEAAGSVGRGRLRVGMIDAAALYLLRAPLERFRSEHPDVSLAITVAGSAELEQRLTDFRDDVVIVIGPAERGDSVPLLSEPLHLYRPGPVADGGSFALYPRGSRTRAAIDAGLAAAGIEPRVTVESGNPAVLRELAILTGSLTVLPADVAESAQPLEPVIEHVASRDIVMVVREASTLARLPAEFVAGLSS